MKSNTEMLKIAQKYLGQGGARFRKFCGLPSGAAWCNAFVDYVANESGNASLFFGGKKMTYCPTSMSWCKKNLAQIPIYLALPCDIIYFDWEPNNVPNHIGLVRERKSDQAVYTIEGNTSGGIVAQKIRPVKYVCGCYRPHFKPTSFNANKKLDVDGYFGYNSIAVMQRWLGVTVDGILGQGTVKALQKKLGVTQDGSWGTKTSKALQKLIGTAVDGDFGAKSVKALQTYLNKKVFATPSVMDKWFDAMKTQYEWSKNQKYKWTTPTIASSKKQGTCITFVAVSLQRMGLIPSGSYFYFDPETNKITGKAADIVKAGKKFELSYPNKTIKELNLKKGDIVGYDNPYYHTMVYMGMKNSRPIFNTMGNTKGLGIYYPTYENRKVNMVVRIRG